MSEKKRFHPLALFTHLLKSIKSSIYAIVLFIGAVSREKFSPIVLLIICVCILLLLFIKPVIFYLTQYYQIHDDKITLYKGLIKKVETDIPFERIQTIKKKQWFFLEPFGIIELLIETAGGSGSEAEAEFPAVPVTLYDELERRRIESHTNGKTSNSEEITTTVEVQTEQTEATKFHISNKQIILFAITDLKIFAVGFAGLVFLQELLPETFLDSLGEQFKILFQFGNIVIGIVVLFLLVFLGVISLVKTMIRYFNFTVSRNGDSLVIESGLFQRRVQTVPVKKIQALSIKQQLLRRVFHLSSVELVIAGGQEKEEGEMRAHFFFLPIVNDKEVHEKIHQLLPEWEVEQEDIQYVSRNHPWYFVRWELLILPLCIGGFFIHWGVSVGFGLLFLLLLTFGLLNFFYQGVAIRGENVLFQKYKGFTKVKEQTKRKNIQLFECSTTPFLYRKRLGHVTIYLKEGLLPHAVDVRFVKEETMQALKEMYFNRK